MITKKLNNYWWIIISLQMFVFGSRCPCQLDWKLLLCCFFSVTVVSTCWEWKKLRTLKAKAGMLCCLAASFNLSKEFSAPGTLPSVFWYSLEHQLFWEIIINGFFFFFFQTLLDISASTQYVLSVNASFTSRKKTHDCGTTNAKKKLLCWRKSKEKHTETCSY